MPTKYPKGSYIVRGEERRKILEELGEIRFLSYASNKTDWRNAWENSLWDMRTVQDLELLGGKTEEPGLSDEELEVEVTKELIKPKAPEPWKPKAGNIYWYVDEMCEVIQTRCELPYNALMDVARVGNLYPTREVAEKAAERVRKAYRG